MAFEAVGGRAVIGRRGCGDGEDVGAGGADYGLLEGFGGLFGDGGGTEEHFGDELDDTGLAICFRLPASEQESLNKSADRSTGRDPNFESKISHFAAKTNSVPADPCRSDDPKFVAVEDARTYFLFNPHKLSFALSNSCTFPQLPSIF